MKISVVGTGYVGLVTGVGLASIGHQVVCVDIDAAKVKKINNGQSPIHEKDLDKLLKKVLVMSIQKRLNIWPVLLFLKKHFFTQTIQSCVIPKINHGDFIFKKILF